MISFRNLGMDDGYGGLFGSRLLMRSVRSLAWGVAEPVATLSTLLPVRRERGVRVERNLPYHHDGKRAHRLDVYRPEAEAAELPVVVYIHGGGFQTLSKNSHRVMALPFAERGFVVVVVNYRLAPQYPFPAALVDCARALEWFGFRARAFGADLNRMVFAGESAGANLALALSLMCCYRRTEAWSRRVHALGVAPRALVSYYGLLQVSDPGRFQRDNPRIPDWAQNQIRNVSDAYLQVDPRLPAGALELADPLLLLEQHRAPVRKIPACFAAVGVRDPLLPDTRRLTEAALAHGVAARAAYYPQQLHGFHALGRPRVVLQCWSDTFDFLSEHV